ncbi:MAG: hypothetical protein IT454_22025 [Planctomycetes bacterium]|nr:hypothetical protein [Planctomycetota bacterium]
MTLAAWLLILWAQVSAPFDAAARKEAWRTALALDLPTEVLAECAPLLAPGGPLERDGEAHALAARALFAAKSAAFDAAWAALERARPSAESAAWIELERVRLLLESDELARALMAILPEPAASTPRWSEHAEAWLLAGRAWVRSGQAGRAAPFLAKFVELAPRDREVASALHLLAQEALARGDGASAQKLVARAEQASKWHALWKVRTTQVREQPDEPLPRLGLGQLWLQAGEPARAKHELEELCRRHPTYAAGWFHLGEAERALGQLPAALDDYSKTLELDPAHVLALNNRGMIQRMAGNLAAARADFERIADGPHAREPLALGAHLNLARVLEQLGERDAAQRRFAVYVQLGGREPLSPPAK